MGGRMRQYVYFKDLPLNALFTYNGNKCKKVSSRTALYIEYNRRFYFGQNDICIIGSHNRTGV